MIPSKLGGIALGLWLLASPAVLGYTGAPLVVDRVVGPLAIAASVVAMAEVTRPVRYALVPLGLLLMLAPWPLFYTSVPALDSVVVGLCLIALGFIGGRLHHCYGGGWRALARPAPAPPPPPPTPPGAPPSASGEIVRRPHCTRRRPPAPRMFS